MSDVPRLSPIDYLVLRKFGRLEFDDSLEPSIDEFGPRDEFNRRLAEYRQVLATYTPNQIAELQKDEQRKQLAEALLRRSNEENKLFFHQPCATADFDHWSKCAHWTLDEAIALSFGKAPEVVDWERLKLYREAYEVPRQYARRRDLALRALHWRLLFDPVLPGIFLAWAKRNDFDVPPELLRQVEARGVVVADWKDLYDRVKRENDQLESTIRNEIAQRDLLAARVAELELQLRSQQESLQPEIPIDANIGQRAESAYLYTIAALLGLLRAKQLNGTPFYSSLAAVISAIGTQIPASTVYRPENWKPSSPRRIKQ